MSSVYYPTQAIRFATTTDILGVAFDPATVTLHVQDPSGAITTYSAPSSGAPPDWTPATGAFYQDVTLASDATIGPWSYWWTCTGALPNQAGVSTPRDFVVEQP